MSPSGTSVTGLGRAIEVTGMVQGVGFRPFVWRLAHRCGVCGWVRNSDGIVQIRVEGSEEALDAFCSALREDAPPLARVEEIRWTSIRPEGLSEFEVDESIDAHGTERLVSSDVATCQACLEELFDPDDRRFLYPFINCTDCGPRFTITEQLPYDRANTSMRRFKLCAHCTREYRDPSNRRFHAEPVACPACGPALELLDAEWSRVPGDPIEGAASALRRGSIVAVKGLGGFHLACDATNEGTVAELRRRKDRPDKPFAVMVADLESAREWFVPSREEQALLAGPVAPIVLVADRRLLAPSVAPGHRRQGAMLPSTPLHHLLLREFHWPLVMTSGNRTEEPICITNEDARERLGAIADAFLVHDRDIVARYDDSVMTARHGHAVMRRARGLAPAPLKLPVPVEPTLGCGAMLNGTFCLAHGTHALLSQHIGELDTEETMNAYHDALKRFRRLFGVEPRVVAHDLHPDFLTTRFAESTGLPRVAVQHHHAHVAAVMAEHGLPGPVIGVAFDGFGLGEDGEVWGGEFLVCTWRDARRAGHLRCVPQPGGDAAVRHPARMAIAHAADAGCLEEALALLGDDGSDAELVLAQAESGLASPLTSSVGRLFDAVSALTGTCRLTTYDGQPAMLLEQIATPPWTSGYEVEFYPDDGRLVLDTRPIVQGVVRDLTDGREPSKVAGRFHWTLAAATLEACRVIRGETGVEQVCLSGGVFQNDLLTSYLRAHLASCGFKVFWPREAPPGDGGISLGQVLVAHGKRGD